MSKIFTREISGWNAWVLVIGFVSGCANNPYADAPTLGQAVQQAVKAQTLNPDAGQNHLPPPETDGVAMKSAIDLYHHSFSKPAGPVNVLSIGLGGSGASIGR